jgi:hypothetical protein
MSPLFGRKKEEEKPSKITSGCCDLCRFSSKVEENVSPESYKLLSRFILNPSTASKIIDPEDSLKNARKYEKAGDISSALRSYSEAFIGSLVKGAGMEMYREECIGFLERHGIESKVYAEVEDYRRPKPDDVKILSQSYIDFIGSMPKPGEKKK